MVHTKKHKKRFLGMQDDDFSNENFLEGGIIRPAILTLSTISFAVAAVLLAYNNLRWGGSAIIFSFVLIMYSIYQSLGDKPSKFRTLNIGFKVSLFIIEVAAFNWILSRILY